jgi:glycosyltransferase involved in cell wall biosynthesis
LHEGLRALGEKSRMYVFNKSSADADTVRYEPAQDRLSFQMRKFRRAKLEREMRRYDQSSSAERTFFSDDRTEFYRDVCRQIPDADILNLHWIAEFIDYTAFFAWLPKSRPVVWTLHDMSPFTGGCCYDLDCGKFTQKCGACPQLGSEDEGDLTRRIWERKAVSYRALSGGGFHVVTPSRWLAEEAKRSSLLSKFPVSVIPYGLDTSVFVPRDRQESREVLGIPKGAKAILFVSQDITMPRKGFPVLAKALEGMDSENVFLISLGVGRAREVQRFRHVHIPAVNHNGMLSLIYSAADVFVLPSLADNLPNTMLEAMACGTPVVAFEAGGIPDGVRPGVTGLLARTGDDAELRAAMLELLNNDAKRAEMSANCRRIAVADYGLELQAKRYLEIYESLLSATRAARAS